MSTLVPIGSTKRVYWGTIRHSIRQEEDYRRQHLHSSPEYTYPELKPWQDVRGIADDECNVVRRAQWTPDGSSVLSTHEDCGVRLTIAPSDLLSSPSVSDLPLYSRVFFPQPVLSTTVFPGFSLADPTSCLTLIATRNVPVMLYNMLTSQQVASYSFFDYCNERILPAYSTAFNPTGSLLAAGGESVIELFATERPGQKAVMSLKTSKEPPEVRFNGIISSLSFLGEQNDAQRDILTASSYSGAIAVVDTRSGSVTMSSKSVHSRGISQVLTSRDSNFLFAVPRQGSEIPVLDLRMNMLQMATLRGFQGTTKQRIWCDSSATGELYAGGCDGQILCWPDASLGVSDCCKPLLPSPAPACVSSVSLNRVESRVIAMGYGNRTETEDSDEESEAEDKFNGKCGINIYSISERCDRDSPIS